MTLLLRWIFLAAAVWGASAAPANPAGQYYEQPDGTSTPLLYLNGNAEHNWMADAKGYTVILDPQGWYVYAKKEQGHLVPSGARVGFANPKKIGLSKGLQTDPHLRLGADDHKDEEMKDHRNLIHVPENALCRFQGTKTDPCRLKGLVLLVKFSDHYRRILPAPEDIDMLFNHNGATSGKIAPTGSVSDVFSENSYGTFVMENIVSPWQNIPRTEEQTVDGRNGFNRPGTKLSWSAAMQMLEDSGFNLEQFDTDGDKEFDSLVIYHSGVAAEGGGIDCESNKDSSQRVWSHMTRSSWWTSSKTGMRVGRFYVASAIWGACPPGGPYTKFDIGRIAVIAHECAHFLGLPDLYDTTVGVGLGNFAMQANMWSWYGTQYYPPLMSAWSKYKLQWVDVTEVTTSGTYTLRQACSNNKILKISQGMPECEYFLLENRYPCGFDVELKHHSGDVTRNRNGVAIWHVDECETLGKDHEGRPVIAFQTEGNPDDDDWPRRHYEVALVQGDGKFDLEKGKNKGDNLDLFRKASSFNEVGSAYAIGPDGIKRNGASALPYPNTNSYHQGYEVRTGIQIEVGEAASTMEVKITLGGSSVTPRSLPPPPTPQPTSPSVSAPLPTNRPTRAPTPYPTPYATAGSTPAPTPRPTRVPTPYPTREPTPVPTVGAPPPSNRPTRVPTPYPTPFPTVGSTPAPTPRPTRVPTPYPTREPTPFPTVGAPDPTNRPTRVPTPYPTVGAPPPTNRPTRVPTPYPTPYATAGSTPLPTRRPTRVPTPYPTPYATTSSVSVEETTTVATAPITCDNSRRDRVMFAVRSNAMRIKSCSSIRRNPTKFCELDDLSRTGHSVWETCQNECKHITKCKRRLRELFNDFQEYWYPLEDENEYGIEDEVDGMEMQEDWYEIQDKDHKEEEAEEYNIEDEEYENMTREEDHAGDESELPDEEYEYKMEKVWYEVSKEEKSQ